MDLAKFRSDIHKNYGKDTQFLIDDINSIQYEKFSSGSMLLDRELKGGYPKGTVIEVYGPSQSGKTTLAIHAAVEHQKKYPDEPILWVDLEKVFDKAYFENIGAKVDEEKFILIRPTKGEDVWDTMIKFVKEVGKGLIVLDSVALLLNSKELDGNAGDAQMAGAARLNSQGFRMMFPHMGTNQVTLIAINQLRKNIGGYGLADVTTGGGCWEYYSRTRIKTFASKGEEGEYSKNRFTLNKANYGNKDAIVETSIEYGIGINRVKEVLDLAIDKGIVQKSGSWFSYGDTKLGQGADNAVDLLRDNPELLEIIEQQIFSEDVDV